MTQIQADFTVKKESIGPPETYLGANIKKIEDGNKSFWTMSSKFYLDKAIKNLKAKFKESGLEYNKKLSDPNHSPKQPYLLLPHIDLNLTFLRNALTYKLLCFKT